jgi:hypothetical protein
MRCFAVLPPAASAAEPAVLADAHGAQVPERRAADTAAFAPHGRERVHGRRDTNTMPTIFRRSARSVRAVTVREAALGQDANSAPTMPCVDAAFIPTFSKAVNLDLVPSALVTQIIHELHEIAASLESLPRDGRVWRSLTRARLVMIVQGRTVEYVIEPERRRIVVLSVSP